ncbi:MAG TPA: hypothetical protein VF188_14245 [Longimicrobiales bacterium]
MPVAAARGAACLSILALLCAPPVRAQGAARAPAVLELPASTRALALGGAFVSVGGDPDAIFYNPALLTAARGIGLAAQRYGSASTLATVSAAIEMEPGGIGIGVQMLDYGAPADAAPGTAFPTRGDLLERGPVPASDLVVSLGYARPVKGVRLGIVGKYIEQRVAGERAGTAAVDLGAAKELFGATIGLAIQNLGRGFDAGGTRIPLPRRITLSAAHPRKIVGPFDLITTASVATLEDWTVVPGLGVELAWWPVVGKTFVGRIGFRHAASDTVSPVTFGGAFIGDRFTLEYAYEGVEGPGGGHRVGIRWEG